MRKKRLLSFGLTLILVISCTLYAVVAQGSSKPFQHDMEISLSPASSTIQVKDRIDIPDRYRHKQKDTESLEFSLHAALTIDAVENRGFEYHTGVTFAFFSKSSRGELGRGGRYQTDFGPAVEQASGLTLFMDTILRALPSDKSKDIILLGPKTSRNEAIKLRSEGWIAIQQLDDRAKPEIEAKRLGCSHVFTNAKITKIKK